jgi:hypothetical protein
VAKSSGGGVGTTSPVAQGSESWQRRMLCIYIFHSGNLACFFKLNNLLRANQRTPKTSQAHTTAKRTLNPCNNPHHRINMAGAGSSTVRFWHSAFLLGRGSESIPVPEQFANELLPSLTFAFTSSPSSSPLSPSSSRLDAMLIS